MNPAWCAFLIFLFSLAGCDGLHKENVTDRTATLQLKSFAEDFMASHSNWDLNEGIDSKTNQEFRDSLEMAIRHGVLDDLPMEMGDLHEYSWGKYVADFSIPSKNTIYGNPFFKKVDFRVVGLIDQAKTRGLKKGRSYFVKGRFVKFVSGEYIGCANDSACATFIGLTQNPPAFKLSMGIVLMDIDKLTEVM